MFLEKPTTINPLVKRLFPINRTHFIIDWKNSSYHSEFTTILFSFIGIK